jgi:5-methylcytosine-specific restriction protein A
LAKRLYEFPVWRKLRTLKLAQDPLCEYCRTQGLLTPATDVDHIVPLVAGGEPLDMGNLQSLCHWCHSRKTNRENTTDKPLLGCDVHRVPLDPNHPWNHQWG